jgi:glycosyltransferase involved in cell wall biosynthesis
VRVAQVAPLQEAVPPRFYGGTERVVSYLTGNLVQLGHDVTLFASGDSETYARLVPICRQALRLDPDCENPVPYEILALEAVIREADDFDLIHFHEACLHLPWTRRVRCATVTTMHGRLDLRDLVTLYREYTDVPLVSISDAQRKPMQWANWRATVYHGLPDDLYRFHPEPGGYLAFLGRICPEKRVDRAISIAKRAGIELKIAAKVDAADKEYFETEIRHLLDDPLVDFIGEIGDHEKEAFLRGAAALLMPIGWPEPFGLVVIESMACGTPVIAFPFGSMPELIEPGVNGALVESIDQAVAVVEALAALDRTLCRRSFEERFTTARMARDYVLVYEALVAEAVSSPGRAALPATEIPIAVPALVAERQPAAWFDRTGVDGHDRDEEAPLSTRASSVVREARTYAPRRSRPAPRR